MTFFILFSSLKSPFYPFIFYIFAWVKKNRTFHYYSNYLI